MPIAKIQMPDGRVARIEVQEGTTPEQALAFAQSEVDKADEFVRQALAQKPPQEQAPQEPRGVVGDIAHQFGVAARGGIEGAGGFAGIFSIPVAYLQEKATGVPAYSGHEAGAMLADTLGLPKAESPAERVMQSAVGVAVPVAGQAGLAAKGAQMAPGAVQQLSQTLARAPAAQVTGAVTGGAAGQVAQEAGLPWYAQFGAGLVGGFGGAAAPAIGVKLVDAAMTAVRSLKGTRPTTQDAVQALNDSLRENGIKVGDIGNEARGAMLKEMKRALDTGSEVDPAVLGRIADYGVVGATPTRGSSTLDPVQITQERNLAKFGANSPNPQMQQLARTQNVNDKALTGKLTEMGADRAEGAFETGTKIKEAMVAVDAPRKAAVDRAYAAVRADSGRAANIDRQAFANMANDSMDAKQVGHFLPAEVRSALNDISSGKMPFTVDIMEQLDKVLSAQMRKANASADGNAYHAVKSVREALWAAPIESAAGEQAVAKYDIARRLAAQRFSKIEKNPAMVAALDDAAPDKFVNDFIIGSGQKANVRDVVAMVRDLRRVPEAFQSAKAQILYHLQDKAIGGRLPELSGFSPSAYNREMKRIGDIKLRLFFNRSEMAQLKAVGRVASYEKFQPPGSAVNNSNTAAMAAGMIERMVSNTAIAKIPVLRALASFASDQARNASGKVAAKNAMQPTFSSPAQAAGPYALPTKTSIPQLLIPGAMGAQDQ